MHCILNRSFRLGRASHIYKYIFRLQNTKMSIIWFLNVSSVVQYTTCTTMQIINAWFWCTRVRTAMPYILILCLYNLFFFIIYAAQTRNTIIYGKEQPQRVKMQWHHFRCNFECVCVRVLRGPAPV